MIPHLPLIPKYYYALFLLVASLLVVRGFSSRTSHAWQVLAEGKTSHSTSINEITFTDSRHGWALNPFQLSETNDGGETWIPRLESKNGERGFSSFEFVSPTTGFIVGGKREEGRPASLILRTNDGGKSWQESSYKVSSPEGEFWTQLNSVSFCNPQVGWVAGSGLIAHTSDGGQTWETQRDSVDGEWLLSIKCLSPERAWAVGSNGLILYTRDGGRHWERQNIGTDDTLLRVRFFGNTGWIVGGLPESGILLRTRDNGVTWEQVKIDSSSTLADIYMSGQQGWVVGTKGTILYTNDNGQTWLQEKSPTSNDLIRVFFLNSKQGWIGGDKLTILRFAE